MTRPLRRGHFVAWLVLAAATAVVLVSGLSARRTSTPANPDLRWENLR